MRVLMLHAFYQELGGEDLSYLAECDLLESHGQEVVRFTVDNSGLALMGRAEQAVRTIWNQKMRVEIRQALRAHKPDVMHCTNTFPLISPACYWAAADEGIPVVQALRNYRPLCPAATFYRNGSICTECLGRPVGLSAIRHGCYRGSRAASATIALQSSLHRAIGTWRHVQTFYTPTQFTRECFVQAGFDGDRIFVKPNFLDPDPCPGDGGAGGAIFVGRLASEKGVETLLAAWRELREPFPLRVVGRGPLEGTVMRAAAADPRITYMGFQPPDRVLRLIGEASCLVMPSTWYETFGRTIIEAYARGTPVIASDLGAMAEIVEHGRTGLLFPAGDARALADAVRTISGNPDLAERLRQAARSEYLRKYTGDVNFPFLMRIYSHAMGQAVAAPVQLCGPVSPA
jgi:glycosyltransferase involved in cell wall biosynthesis